MGPGFPAEGRDQHRRLVAPPCAARLLRVVVIDVVWSFAESVM